MNHKYVEFTIQNSDQVNFDSTKRTNSLDFDVDLQNKSLDFDMEKVKVKEIYRDVPVYSNSDVTVVSKPFEDQKYETKGYKLNGDIIVKAIPTYETSNSSGTTFYIG